MRIIGNLDGTGLYYKVVEGEKIELTADEKALFLIGAAAHIQAQEDNKYVAARTQAYEAAFSLADQIDIIQKQLQSMIGLGEVTAVAETQTWLDTIADIKTDNPKPADIAIAKANENAAI